MSAWREKERNLGYCWTTGVCFCTVFSFTTRILSLWSIYLGSVLESSFVPRTEGCCLKPAPKLEHTNTSVCSSCICSRLLSYKFYRNLVLRYGKIMKRCSLPTLVSSWYGGGGEGAVVKLSQAACLEIVLLVIGYTGGALALRVMMYYCSLRRLGFVVWFESWLWEVGLCDTACDVLESQPARYGDRMYNKPSLNKYISWFKYYSWRGW